MYTLNIQKGDDMKKQISMRLSEPAKFLADKVGQAMGGFDRTSVVELAILELAHSELQRGRLKPEVMQEYQRMLHSKNG